MSKLSVLSRPGFTCTGLLFVAVGMFVRSFVCLFLRGDG